MRGDIVILHVGGWSVSNMADLDYRKDIIDTPEGRRSITRRAFRVDNPYHGAGRYRHGDKVQVAFRAEDGSKVSYACVVDGTELKILEQKNDYISIIERALRWQTELQASY